MGPLFWHEMRRLGRKSRFYGLRLAFLTLLGFLCWSYYGAFEERLQRETAFQIVVGGQTFFGRPVSVVDPNRISKAVAWLGHEFLYTFLIVEALVVMLLAPLMVASALEEERRLRTLELLLTTHLSPGLILVGKALPRVLLLGTLILGGLAIPALAQLQGGIDPALVFTSMMVLLSGLLSQAAITLWHAAGGSSLQTVLLMNYLLLAAWLLVGVAPLSGAVPWLDEILIWTNAPRQLRFLSEEFFRTGSLGQWPWKLAWVHVLIHVGLSVVLLLLAGWSLRRSLEHHRLAGTGGAAGRKARRRPVFDEQQPLLWKECGPTARGSTWGWLFVGAVLVAIFVMQEVYQWMDRILLYGKRVNDITILGFLTVGIPMILAALGAAWSVRRETERATWDVLMATPIQVRDLMAAKWQASWLGVSRPMMALGLAMSLYFLFIIQTWAPWVLRSEYAVQAVVYLLMLALNMMLACSLAISMGLLMSVVCRTGLQALVATMLVLSALVGVPLAFFEASRWKALASLPHFLLFMVSLAEVIAGLGALLLVLLTIGIFSRRWRLLLRGLLRLLGLLLLAGLALQLPMLMTLGLLAALLPDFNPENAIPPFSPMGFILSVFRGKNLPYCGLALVSNGVLSYLIFRVACLLAERRCGRIDARTRSFARRRLK